MSNQALSPSNFNMMYSPSHMKDPATSMSASCGIDKTARTIYMAPSHPLRISHALPLQRSFASLMEQLSTPRDSRTSATLLRPSQGSSDCVLPTRLILAPSPHLLTQLTHTFAASSHIKSGSSNLRFLSSRTATTTGRPYTFSANASLHYDGVCRVEQAQAQARVAEIRHS